MPAPLRSSARATSTFSVQVPPVADGSGPAGTVTFLLDGNPISTVPVDPATGLATLSTTSIGPGNHTITAAYSGDSNYQSNSSLETFAVVVNPASTQTVSTVQAVRNRHGKVTAISLVARVTVVPPGAGVPAGVLTLFRKGKPYQQLNLIGGAASFTLKPKLAMKTPFIIRYSGAAEFQGSSSATLEIARSSLGH